MPASAPIDQCTSGVVLLCIRQIRVCGAGENLRIVVETEIREDADLRRAWNDLAVRMERPEIFYTHEWALAVQRSYGDQLRPLVFLAYEGESLVGVVALATDKTGSLVFLTASTADYCDFLSEPGRRHEFVDAVFAELKERRSAKVVLTNLPADSNTMVSIRQAAQLHGSQCFERTAYVCARVVFNRLERDKVGKPVAPGLKRVRRLMKAVGAESPIGFDHSRSWDAVQPILPQFMQAHISRFLEIGRISNFADARRRDFLAGLAKLLSGSQWLVLSRMIAGDQAVAWHYGFQFCGSWFWYQPTFDSRLEKHWPGFCLLTRVIQEAIEDPALQILDLGLGSEAYKSKFANDSRETLYVVLHNSHLKHWSSMLRYRAASAVRSVPAVEKIAEGFRRKSRSFRKRLGRDGIKKTLVWAVDRALRLLWADDEVLFYEFVGRKQPADSGAFSVRPIDLALLSAAVVQYSEDEETLTYLLRCAKRLRIEGFSGFALVTAEGTPVHFCWAKNFEGFEMAELGRKLQAPCANAAMIFDCFTPRSARGHGFFAEAIGAVARRLHSEGKAPWIFGAETNKASLRGIEKSGFTFKFSLGRRKVFGIVKEKDSIAMRDLATVPGPVPAP
jgi:CelD/BcsL family acetyltransferase involved in cellulose biosynthesis